MLVFAKLRMIRHGLGQTDLDPGNRKEQLTEIATKYGVLVAANDT
jgi:hypothetical protein